MVVHDNNDNDVCESVLIENLWQQVVWRVSRDNLLILIENLFSKAATTTSFNPAEHEGGGCWLLYSNENVNTEMVQNANTIQFDFI